MNWQPLIDQAALWLAWPPWKYLVFAMVVWHLMIGRLVAIRWLEALGWRGAQGFFERIGWIKPLPENPDVRTVEQTRVSTLVRP